MMAAQLSEQQLWTLDKLGIPVWQLRQNAEPETTAELASPEQNVTHTPKTINSDTQLLVCYSPTQVPSEQQLLANISKAIAGLNVMFELCESESLTQLSAEMPLPRVLVFGELPAETVSPLQDRCTLLPSLRDLIAEPEGKAAVWAAICQFQ